MLGRLLKQLLATNSTAQPPASAFDMGVAAYARSDHEAAARHFDAAITSEPGRAEAWFYAGLVAYDSGSYPKALALAERACALAPEHAGYRYQAGAAHWRLGEGEAARACCEQALRFAPGFALAYTLMAEIALPGPGYIDLLAAIHRHLKPRTYVEVGVFTGRSIALALPQTRVIGIDPEPKIEFPLAANTTIHACASDDYFAGHDLKLELGGLPVDLAFIDGMHHFEFALRDFIHIERQCAPGSTILIHDCYPFDRRTAERERQCDFWSGDAWRLVLLLKKYRPELRIDTIATSPTGLGVVRGLDPDSCVLAERQDALIAEFLALDYGVLEGDKPGMLNLCPNHWGRIAQLFA